MSSVLYVIFSYNRLPYLKNLLSSLSRFASADDVLIIDDGSTDGGLISWLETVQSEKVEVIFLPKKKGNVGSLHGRLWENKNRALDYAIENKYRYACFLDDDMQLVYAQSDLINLLDRIFYLHHNCVQIETIFQKKFVYERLAQRCDHYSISQASWLKPYGLADTGYINIERVVQLQVRFGQSKEGEYSQAGSVPLERLIAHVPNMAFVPWPVAFHRGRESSSTFFADPPVLHENGLFLPDIKSVDRERLENRSFPSFAFLEDYVRIRTWGAVAPFWYTKPYLHALSKAYYTYWRASGCFPGTVGSMTAHKKIARNALAVGLTLFFPLIDCYHRFCFKPLVSCAIKARNFMLERILERK